MSLVPALVVLLPPELDPQAGNAKAATSSASKTITIIDNRRGMFTVVLSFVRSPPSTSYPIVPRDAPPWRRRWATLNL